MLTAHHCHEDVQGLWLWELFTGTQHFLKFYLIDKKISVFRVWSNILKSKTRKGFTRPKNSVLFLLLNLCVLWGREKSNGCSLYRPHSCTTASTLQVKSGHNPCWDIVWLWDQVSRAPLHLKRSASILLPWCFSCSYLDFKEAWFYPCDNYFVINPKIQRLKPDDSFLTFNLVAIWEFFRGRTA